MKKISQPFLTLLVLFATPACSSGNDMTEDVIVEGPSDPDPDPEPKPELISLLNPT